MSRGHPDRRRNAPEFRAPRVAAIRELLKANGLPWEDVSRERISDFVALYDATGLVAAGGLEVATPDALLRSVVTAEPYRNQGLAVRILNRLERHAGKEGVTCLYLLTTDADRWFHAQGFRTIARDQVPDSIAAMREYAELCPASATVMRKGLAGSATVRAG